MTPLRNPVVRCCSAAILPFVVVMIVLAEEGSAGEPSCKRLRAPVVFGEPSEESPACRRLRQRLDRLQTRLRAGYHEPRGYRLREQRRALTDRWLSTCFP